MWIASSFRVVPSDNSLGSEELMSDPFGLRSLRTRVVHVPEYNFRVSPTRDVDVVVNVEVDSMSVRDVVVDDQQNRSEGNVEGDDEDDNPD